MKRLRIMCLLAAFVAGLVCESTSTDALRRLLAADPADEFLFDADGVMTAASPIEPADVVAVFAYDALGRLVGRQAPWPDIAGEWRTETYFYDGARRIAERWRDPIPEVGGGGANGLQQQDAPTHHAWTEREYVHTPGYVDEFVCEIDAEGVAWPILQDANYNAVALADDAGAVVAQRVLSPYGRVLISDPPAGAATPPLSRVGHQGLFAERLDGDTLDDPLAAGGTLAWHNRNRTLLSDLGRFAQRDPNATGQGVDSALRRHGEAPASSEIITRPDILFGNGLSLYAFGMVSPTHWTDPTGLFVHLLMPGPSDFVTGALDELVNQYSDRLMFDVMWATDWEAGDDWHSRSDNSWIALALARGAHNAFEIGIGPFAINPLDMFSRVGFPRWMRRLARSTSTHLHHIATPYGEFGLQLRKILDRGGLKINHHLNGMRLDPGTHIPGKNHSRAYHKEVMRRLDRASQGLPKAEAAKALEAELLRIRADIRAGRLSLY